MDGSKEVFMQYMEQKNINTYESKSTGWLMSHLYFCLCHFRTDKTYM